jgi:hypothetical protein
LPRRNGFTYAHCKGMTRPTMDGRQKRLSPSADSYRSKNERQKHERERRKGARKQKAPNAAVLVPRDRNPIQPNAASWQGAFSS